MPRQLPPCAHVPAPYAGPTKAEVLALRQRHCNPAIFTYYQEPLMIVEGHRQYLFDETGRRYLDLFAGIVTVPCGHSHPKVVAAARSQLERLQHTTTIYLHPLLGEFARQLAGKLPAGLDVVYFVNSGSEANDLALTMARLYTGHSEVIALRNGYHGGSSSMMGVTALHTWKYPLPQGQGVHHAICPDPYRSPYPGSPAEIARQSAGDLEETIRFSTPGRIAAFIAEPIQGVGGVTTAPPEYYPLAYEVVRRHGGLCIADEVQTGFGRTGDHYWGFENFGVIPDIVTLAKGIGNGAPLAAVATRREIAQTLAQRLHFNTFGGNPVSMAQGLAVLEVIEEEGLQENARVVGRRFKAGLQKLQSRHPFIGDVRGQGLMLGVELVLDRQTKAPAPAQTARLWEYARQQGVLIGKGGLYANVLRLKPPMCISAEDVDFALEVLDEGLKEIEKEPL
jgi:alanine-glyoxylate transaminase/(R)-3-amino-2-methylpropionate-pyruvate transaminase